MFARYGLNDAGPALYKTTVDREGVFAYINESGRREQEVLVLLGKSIPSNDCRCRASAASL
jgi:phage-related protein